jgi:hypothetical protein
MRGMTSFKRSPRAPLATLLALGLSLPLLSTPVLAQWKKLAPPKGGFSVMMPGTAKATRKVEKDKDGTQTVDQQYELERDNILLNVGYQEYDARAARLVNGKELLNEVTSEMLKSMGAQGAKSREVTLNGFAGREVSADVDGATMKMRAYWAGRRMYFQLAVYNGSSKATATRFLSSLRLSKPQPR